MTINVALGIHFRKLCNKLVCLLFGYVIAVLLSFHCPNVFTTIAFDAGGVASGVMAATFLLPLSIGICNSRGASANEIMIDAFGTIALVAMMPTISIQIVGLMYKIKLGRTHDITVEDTDTVIIEEIPVAAPVENPVESPVSMLDDDDVEIIDFPLENEESQDVTSSSLNS